MHVSQQMFKRKIIVLLVIMYVCIFGSAVIAQEWYYNLPIADIRFEGLQVIKLKDVQFIIDNFKGKKFTDDVWLELLSKLYDLDYFETIEPTAVAASAKKDSVVIIIKVTEKPSVDAIVFSGNEKIRSNELLDVLNSKVGAIYKESKVVNDIALIEKFYLDKGYPSVSVSYSITTKNNKVTIQFEITETAQMILEKINFTGNSVLSSSVLKGQLSLKEKNLFQSGVFNEQKLQQDKLAIEFFYKSRGYMKAKVDSIDKQVRFDEKKNIQYLTVTFTISEGNRYTFGGITFRGNNVFPTAQLEALVSLKPGDVLNYRKLMESKARIDDLYYENGYIFNQIELRDTWDDEQGIVSYEVVIVERERAHIEHIIIQGNYKTKDHVIYREIPLEPGDVFSKTKVIDGLRNLYNLQYFASVTPELKPGSEDLLMDLVFTVEEQSTAEIQFGVTLENIGSGSLPTGVIKWNDKNFLGNGQTLSINADISKDSQDLSFGFTESWLFNRRWSGTIQLMFKHESLTTLQDSIGPIFAYDDPLRVPDPFTTIEEYTNANGLVPSSWKMPYENWSIGLSLATGYLFKTGIGDIGLGTGFISSLNSKSYDSELYRPYDPLIAQNLGKWLFGNSIFIRGYLNGLDIWYDPSKGYFASDRLTLYGIFNSELEHYMRNDFKLEGYFTLFSYKFSEESFIPNWVFKLVVGAHSGINTIFAKPGCTAPVISTANMLRIDGSFIGRGWASDSTNNVAAITGTALWENWVELRMPIIPGIFSFDTFWEMVALQTNSGLLNIAALKTGATSIYDADRTIFTPSLSNFTYGLGFGIRFTLQQFPFKLYFVQRYYHDGSALKNVKEGLDFVLSISQPLN
ncbi:MAG TPA: outer membrane protein assembly factor BamA [Spirochaetales bacterium]|nr:outer membrane protein assembly factor BamA [Spirochaetales bacterium]HOT58628.1 outer membrane protein assembly factor BamA [Spirochaetales bacterium]HQK33944.1 outer membrane protein assembly factor BamA [Spirochaetales bacterium]